MYTMFEEVERKYLYLKEKETVQDENLYSQKTADTRKAETESLLFYFMEIFNTEKVFVHQKKKDSAYFGLSDDGKKCTSVNKILLVYQMETTGQGNININDKTCMLQGVVTAVAAEVMIVVYQHNTQHQVVHTVD